MAKNPIKITDTTFRDGHQSLMATRLRMEDMEPIAGKMDEMGFHSMEVWGGATFDVATRFLAEDPWERLRTFKRLMPKTPLMMLLRGQSLVGYRTYADDLVDAFVQRSAEVGIDIFRVFDALNDERNIERSAEAVKKNGKHLQLAICYSVTEEGRLGGPIYNLDYFVGKAKRFQEMGVPFQDGIAITGYRIRQVLVFHHLRTANLANLDCFHGPSSCAKLVSHQGWSPSAGSIHII